MASRREDFLLSLGPSRATTFPFVFSEWFAIGRAVREAALHGLQSAMNMIAKTATDGSASAADLTFFAGVLHGLYFDAHPPAVPTTRVGDAAVQTDKDAA